MATRMVKIKANIPYHLENRLVNHWGYAVDKRVIGDFILLKKTYVSDKTANDDGLKRTIRAGVDKPTTTTVDEKIVYPKFGLELSSYQKKQLEKRCDNIVNFFPDPYSVPESVRARLRAIIGKLTSSEAQFVIEYMDENFPAVDKGD